MIYTLPQLKHTVQPIVVLSESFTPMETYGFLRNCGPLQDLHILALERFAGGVHEIVVLLEYGFVTRPARGA